MKCPFCNNYFTIVENSREIENGTKRSYISAKERSGIGEKIL